jgi:hypothetical protein
LPSARFHGRIGRPRLRPVAPRSQLLPGRHGAPSFCQLTWRMVAAAIGIPIRLLCGPCRDVSLSRVLYNAAFHQLASNYRDLAVRDRAEARRLLVDGRGFVCVERRADQRLRRVGLSAFAHDLCKRMVCALSGADHKSLSAHFPNGGGPGLCLVRLFASCRAGDRGSVLRARGRRRVFYRSHRHASAGSRWRCASAVRHAERTTLVAASRDGASGSRVSSRRGCRSAPLSECRRDLAAFSGGDLHFGRRVHETDRPLRGASFCDCTVGARRAIPIVSPTGVAGRGYRRDRPASACGFHDHVRPPRHRGCVWPRHGIDRESRRSIPHLHCSVHRLCARLARDRRPAVARWCARLFGASDHTWLAGRGRAAPCRADARLVRCRLRIHIATQKVPRITGYDAVAAYVVNNSEQDSVVLFQGNESKNFVFSIRSHSATPKVFILRAEKLLVNYTIIREWGIADRNLSTSDIEALIDNNRISTVVLQPDFWTDQPSIARLQALVYSDRFQQVAEFPITSDVPSHRTTIKVFRNIRLVPSAERATRSGVQ